MFSAKTVLLTGYFILLCAFAPKKPSYIFHISTDLNGNNLPKNLTVEVMNNDRGSINLNTLVFVFYIDSRGYWATYEPQTSSVGTVTIKPKKHIKKTIPIDSMIFNDYNGYRLVSIDEIKNSILNSKKVKITASISDFRTLKKPLSSSTRIYSNTLELINK